MPQRPDDAAETRASTIAPSDRPPTFAAEELVADRFFIIRFIARGGMGEVYEALDLELNQNLALKTIRPEIAQDERAIARFKREAFLSRQVTHPNICRLYDLFVHRAPATDSGPSRPITFVTMQLLTGQTLADRLRFGRMLPEEALPLVAGMANALDAAHEVGVVHRDFKSSNVMLVPQSGGPRAVVTDFGMAWRAGEDAEKRDTTPTLPGELIGTPDYMAPEQLEGGEVTPATDVYALGLVMYEMVTGARPFEGSSTLAAAVKRLSESARPARTLVPDLDPAWDTAIMRCLARDPAKRFQRAGDVLTALREHVAPITPPKRRALSPVLGVAAAAALLAVAAFVWRGRPAPTPPAPVAAVVEPRVAPRKSVAVLGFRNVSGRAESAWLSTAFAEMLTTELAAGEQLRTIPGENIARMKMELALAEADTYAPDTLGRIRERLGTDLVVLGSYVTVGRPGAGTIRLDARLQDSRAGNTVALVSETGTEGEVLDLVERIGRQLRDRLSVDAPPPAATAAAAATRPRNVEAARLYA
jgi:TolB-like protein